MDQADAIGMQQMWHKLTDPVYGQGLYLTIKGQEFVDLSIVSVLARADEFWRDPLQLDEGLKDNLGFRPCPICSHAGERVLCMAIRPILPIVHVVDRYQSFDETIAVYKDGAGDYHWSRTSLQRALQYVIQMGLIDFCDVGQQYKHWFFGVHPLMKPSEIAKRVYLNLFWLEKGNEPRVREEITSFAEKLKTITTCQIKRISLVAKNDAVINALVNFDMVGLFLNLKAEKELRKEFSRHLHE